MIDFIKLGYWWNNNGFTIAFCLSFILLGIASFMYRNADNRIKLRKLDDVINVYRGIRAPKKKQPGGKKLKNESRCRDVLEREFGCKFHKIRPKWLKNPETGRNLELDMYNHKLRIGLEYNGSQHYHFNPFYHQTQEGFEKQLQRDKFKRKKCKELGIFLISVPYTVPYTEIESYILKKLKDVDYYN